MASTNLEKQSVSVGTPAAWPFEARPLSPPMGAEIFGFDAAQPMSDATRDAVLDALNRYKVLALRDQGFCLRKHRLFSPSASVSWSRM